MNTLEGNLIAKGLKIGIVGARFNEFITSKLISGAMDALVRHDVKEEDVDVAWVPGAFEIPLVAKKMAESGKYDAVICLGAVIRGATSHYDLVCNEAAKGIAHVSLDTGVPVMFGIVTTDTIEQAIERAGTKAGNKGFDCATGAMRWLILLNRSDDRFNESMLRRHENEFTQIDLTIDFRIDASKTRERILSFLRFLSRTKYAQSRIEFKLSLSCLLADFTNYASLKNDNKVNLLKH